MNQFLLFLAIFIFRSLFTDPETPFFRLRLFSELPSIVLIFEDLGCMFSPVLFNILRCTTPPTISILKTLPTIVKGAADEYEWRTRWGVYILVLEKRGHRPGVYVGSATHAKGGMHTRIRDGYWMQHESHVPHYVRRALKAGFKITAVTCPFYLSAPQDDKLVAIAHSICLAVEHALTFALWTINKKWKNCYSLSLWDRDNLPYDGLNSTNPIRERCDLGRLSIEDLVLLLAQRREKARITSIKATKRWRSNNKPLLKVYKKVCANKAKASARFVCEHCGLHLDGNSNLQRHNDAKIPCYTKNFACDVCKTRFVLEQGLRRHQRHTGH